MAFIRELIELVRKVASASIKSLELMGLVGEGQVSIEIFSNVIKRIKVSFKKNKNKEN